MAQSTVFQIQIRIKMKLILLFALMLAIICRFGDCTNGTGHAPNAEPATSNRQTFTQSGRSKVRRSFSLQPSLKKHPNRALRKTVSFNDRPTYIEPAITDDQEDVYFSMNLRNFAQNLVEKAGPYEQVSFESVFLNALLTVVEKNFKMFDPVYHYLNGLRSSDTVLCQSDGIPAFPKKEIIDQLQADKVSIFVRLTSILSSLAPAYELNRKIVGALDLVDDNMRIDPKLCAEINIEAMTVYQIFRHFCRVFKNFPMKAYRRHLRNIRRTIVIDSERENGILAATQTLDNELKELNKIFTDIDKKLGSASEIDFESLHRATKRFSKLVEKALRPKKKASSIEDTIKALRAQEAKLLTDNKASTHDSSFSRSLKAKENALFTKTEYLEARSSVDRAKNLLRAEEAKILIGDSSSSSSSDGSSSSSSRSSSSLSRSSSSSSSSSSSASSSDKKEEKEKRKTNLFGSKMFQKIMTFSQAKDHHPAPYDN